MIERMGIRSGDVVFEVTEREALPHISELSVMMEGLRRKGISLALDDFGSGFSSFIYLKYLTVDYIKIEGSFIKSLSINNGDRIMVEHIRGMAHDFGVLTIGEYVEDRRTHEILDAIGVDFGQGHYYGFPAPAPLGGLGSAAVL